MRRDFAPGIWALFLVDLGNGQGLRLLRVDANWPGACSQLLKGVSWLSRSVLARDHGPYLLSYTLSALQGSWVTFSIESLFSYVE